MHHRRYCAPYARAAAHCEPVPDRAAFWPPNSASDVVAPPGCLALAYFGVNKHWETDGPTSGTNASNAPNRVRTPPQASQANVVQVPPGAALALQLRHLQQAAGNSAVTAMLQRQSAVQGPGSGTAAPAKGKRTGRPLPDLERQFRDLISAARGKGYVVAASNLEHFLDGKGATRSVPMTWLRSFSAVTSAEIKNRQASGRFEDQLKTKARGLSDGSTTTFSDYWDAVVDASMTTELFYASGMSQLKSTGTFVLSRSGNTVLIGGDVQQRWFDPYNWNPGSSAWIPGHGSVSDDVGLDLKDAGIGRDYLLENKYKQTMVGWYRFTAWYMPNQFSATWDGP